MKTRFNLILGAVCITFLISCNTIYNKKLENVTDAQISWHTLENVTVIWDAPIAKLDGSPIDPDTVLRYNVYIDLDMDNTHDDMILLTEKPIAETRYTIPKIEHKGQYFIGIQALAFNTTDGELQGEAGVSAISWSYNSSVTKNDPFGVIVE